MSDRDVRDPSHGGPTTGAGPSEDLGGNTAGGEEVTGGGATRQGAPPSEPRDKEPEEQRDREHGRRGTESQRRSAIQG